MQQGGVVVPARAATSGEDPCEGLHGADDLLHEEWCISNNVIFKNNNIIIISAYPHEALPSGSLFNCLLHRLRLVFVPLRN